MRLGRKIKEDVWAPSQDGGDSRESATERETKVTKGNHGLKSGLDQSI